MKIACWNVNGIRSIQKKGFANWVLDNNFDIVCIQENKAQLRDLSLEQHNVSGYKVFWAEAQKKGYSGVSIWVKNSLIVHSSKIGIGSQKFDSEGRTIVLEFKDFYLINGYFPNGREDHSRVQFKLEYSYKVLDIANSLKAYKPVIICGDFNTAHQEIDLANPQANRQTTGFLEEERQFIDHLVKNEFYDVFRLKNINKIIYSWWSYRNLARINNIGWRIDYFFVEKSLLEYVKNIEYKINQMGSDHCPIILEIF